MSRSRTVGGRTLPGRTRVGYSVATGLLTLIFGALWLFEGYYVVTAGFPSLYEEVTPINGVAAGAFMTLMFGCAIAALVRPRAAIGPTRVLLIGAGWLGVLMPLAFVTSDPLVTVVGIGFATVVLSAIVLCHPAREAVRPSSGPTVSWPLVALTVALAIPFLWLAAQYQWQQLTLEDAVADRWFYGGLSMYLLVILSLAAASSVDGSTRRFTGGAAVFLTGLFALVSIVYPDALHSLGFAGGLLALAWAGCLAMFVARG